MEFWDKFMVFENFCENVVNRVSITFLQSLLHKQMHVHVCSSARSLVFDRIGYFVYFFVIGVIIGFYRLVFT